MIAIIDYGMGNIHSVQKALESLGVSTLVTNNPKEIKNCDKLVLPGVGAFRDALLELEKQGLTKAIKEHIKQKKIFLGICLGMQLLFESSEEAPKVKGLAILKGQVKKFAVKKGMKVPHMGWNQLKVTRCAKRSGASPKGTPGHQVTSECELLQGIADNSYVYFCHSYYPQPKENGVIAATTDYGMDFTSVVAKDNVYGMQFHPEKSQEVGLKILKNFIRL